jgi:hypothetical protein
MSSENSAVQSDAHAKSLRERAREEAIHFGIIVIYLWAMFFLFQLHQYVVLEKHDIPIEKFGFGLVNALVFGKVMLLGDNLRLGTRLGASTLVAVIAVRAIIFAVLFVVADTLESLIVGALHHRDFSSSLPSYGGGGLLGAAIIGVIIAFALTPFFAFEEIDRALGPGTLKALLFSARQRTSVEPGRESGSARPSTPEA